MLGALLGPLIGAASNIFGAKQASDDADDARAWSSMQWQQNADLQREFWEKNAALQREFAQSGIRWRVDDAKAAGVHPLFALGGGGASYSPQAVVGSSSDYVPDRSGDYLARMGQDIGRAVAATQTQTERTSDQLTALGLERAQLENDLLKAQIAKTTGQLGPPMPRMSSSSNAVGGSERYGSWEAEPHAVTTAFPGHNESAAGGARPYAQWNDTGTGLRSSPVKDSNIEVDELTSPLGAEWLWRNRVAPLYGASPKPPLELMKKHYGEGVTDSRYSWGEWKPVYGNMKTSVKVPIDRPKEYSAPSYRRPAPGRRPSSGYSGDGFNYVAP